VVFVWWIALFLSLGENYAAFGGALALAGVVGAVSGLALGRHIDAGHGGRAVWVAYGKLNALSRRHHGLAGAGYCGKRAWRAHPLPLRTDIAHRGL
jgi:hypothetical protein